MRREKEKYFVLQSANTLGNFAQVERERKRLEQNEREEGKKKREKKGKIQ